MHSGTLLAVTFSTGPVITKKHNNRIFPTIFFPNIFGKYCGKIISGKILQLFELTAKIFVSISFLIAPNPEQSGPLVFIARIRYTNVRSEKVKLEKIKVNGHFPN